MTIFCAIKGSAVGSSEPIKIKTLNEASAAYRAFLDSNGLGSRDAGNCYIYNGNKVVAYVSYNGKVWEGKKYKADAKPIFEP